MTGMCHILCVSERVVDVGRLFALLLVVSSQLPGPPPPELPIAASQQLKRSLEAAAQHSRHLWRDSPPMNADGTVNAYIEIPRGERRKFEFDMLKHERFIDRVMPESLGGYPVNYGFVPQTVSYDGDPFDALILGPPLAGGTVVKGAIVGLMHMEDEKGVDSKVVLSLLGPKDERQHQLRSADQSRIGDYFRRYKQHEPGKFSRVPGWDSAERGRQFVQMTHQFFLDCRGSDGKACRISQ
jgi:inorganic pyrophosphatase